jgi:hypothetical protein
VRNSRSGALGRPAGRCALANEAFTSASITALPALLPCWTRRSAPHTGTRIQGRTSYTVSSVARGSVSPGCGEHEREKKWMAAQYTLTIQGLDGNVAPALAHQYMIPLGSSVIRHDCQTVPNQLTARRGSVGRLCQSSAHNLFTAKVLQ